MHVRVTCCLLICFVGVAVANGILGVGGPYVPQPYSFGYKVNDKLGQQYRQETGDGKGVVKGSYGFNDARGILRQVNYVADDLGFRANVKTNEPGTANQNPAAVIIESAQG